MNGQIDEDEYKATVQNIDVFMLTMPAIEQLGDKGFAANNVSIGTSGNSDATPATAQGYSRSNADTSTSLPNTDDGKVTSVTINDINQNGEVALYKSRGIVEVTKEYFEWKKYYFNKVLEKSKK